MNRSPKPISPRGFTLIEVLVALGGPGENREGKRRSIKDLCEKRRTGTANGHAVWDALDDFPEY